MNEVAPVSCTVLTYSDSNALIYEFHLFVPWIRNSKGYMSHKVNCEILTCDSIQLWFFNWMLLEKAQMMTEELLEDLSEAKHKSQGFEGKALENVSSSNMELEKDEFEVNCLISTWNSMQSSFRYIWKGSTCEFQRMYSKNEEFYKELFRISSSGEQWKSQCAASL